MALGENHQQVKKEMNRLKECGCSCLPVKVKNISYLFCAIWFLHRPHIYYEGG